MKTAVFATLLLCAGIFHLPSAIAQQKTNSLQRCATMDRVRLYESNNTATKLNGPTGTKKPLDNAGNFRLQGTITIPVVVHIVLPNPYIVTDADVQNQIDRLNQDFAGLNADSTNAGNFYGVRGHGQIQFCLARRTPAGLLTNGIERRWSSTGSDLYQTNDPIKRSVLGGLDAWTTAQYLNLWVGADGSGGGILGYADNVGPGNTLDDGVFINYQSFGTSSCYIIPQYNKGRTVTHEVGHYFGLYHIWGDENGCLGDDFKQLPTSTGFALPDGLYNPDGNGNTVADVGDTPNQSSETSSCPSGTAVDNCAQTAPGKMYQNHMDYTYDACLSMFTKKQVARMEWVLDNCRAELKTSLGCQPPAGATNLDVAPLNAVSPGGFELVGCKPVYYTDTLSCPGSITPKFRVVNNGMQAITSLTVGYSLDGGAAITQTVAVNIPQGGTYVASFAPIAATLGTHTLRFFTANPNGGTDQATSNDSYTKSFTVLAPVVAPVTERFETTLPLANWTIDNADFDFTWQRTTPGKNGSAGKLSINNFQDDGTHNKDDFRSAPIEVDPAAAYLLTFDVAHKSYPDAQYADSLAILVSKDCGQTFSTVYYKGGETLATAGTSNTTYDNPADADWRTEKLTIASDQLSSGKIILLFRNISGYGNWIHLDNINLTRLEGGDLQVLSIQQPKSLICTPTVTPSVIVRNVGFDTVKSFNIVYTLNNGTPVTQTVSGLSLARDAETTVSLPVATGLQPGRFDLTVYSNGLQSARGAGDANTKNDTLRLSFSVPGNVNAPLAETFESTAFPPSGWSVLNGSASFTWQRYAEGAGNVGSAFVNTYKNGNQGQKDVLVTPTLIYEKVDSVNLRFDLAAAGVPGNSAADTLEVLVTTDCGNSFTTVYKKWGTDLQTVGSLPAGTEFFPQRNSGWRQENIDLSTFADRSPLLLYFRVTNNNGNNVFLDNIGFTTRLLPTQLKQQGYLLYPVPFRNSFTVWHYLSPVTLQYIRVMNIAGQTILTKNYSGNAQKQEVIDLTGKSAGLYFVEMGYGNGKKAVVQKVVKE